MTSEPIDDRYQIAGEDRPLTFDFTGKLADGDFLSAVGTTATATILKGSTAATLGSVALEPGAAPKKCSVQIATPAVDHIYRIDLRGRTRDGDLIIARARLTITA